MKISNSSKKNNIRNEFIRQQNKKKDNIEYSSEVRKKSIIRSITPQPKKRYSDFVQTNLNNENNYENDRRKSLTPNKNSSRKHYENYDKENNSQSIDIKSFDKKNILDKYFEKETSPLIKTPNSKKKNAENNDEIMSVYSQPNSQIIEMKKNLLKANFMRDMYYIDHKYKNCPCYKCICGKCFCPIKYLDKKKYPLSNSTYHNDYPMHEGMKKECPLRRMSDFNTKTNGANILDPNLTTYKENFKEFNLPKKIRNKIDKYEPNNIPLMSSTNYNENYKNWGDPKNLSNELMRPIERNVIPGIPLMNATTYNKNFRAPSQSDYKNSRKIRKGTDSRSRSPLNNDFQCPFETENQAKYKPYDLKNILKNISKPNSDNLGDLPQVGNYETDYSKNYKQFLIKPFPCPARIELERLARLEAARFNK